MIGNRFSNYAKAWDRYVNGFKSTAHRWPGDEWAGENFWNLIFQRMFLNYGAADWKRCVEIGAGSGKFTQYLLDSSQAEIVAFDISERFQDVFRERLAEPIRGGRVHPVLLLAREPNEIYADLKTRGWIRQLDALFSIDSMVHVDLQYVMAYVVTAALTLRQGGKLILTMADATSETGYEVLLNGIKNYYAKQDAPNFKFEWVSPGLITHVLERCGFAVDLLALSNRDIYLVGTLRNTDKESRLMASLI